MKEIRLTQGKVTAVDDWNYDWLNQWTWTYGSNYARRHKDGKVFLMHREIMHTPEFMIVDHIDHDCLNNQEYNLRNCTYSQNGQNLRTREKFQGVSWHKRYNKYIAYIRINGKTIYIGYYNLAEEAAEAYNIAALHYYGPGAKLNEISKFLPN